ncbi:MAG TPA: PQQ-binding-like beta-propeller repeat protein [Pirellulales bacterium]|nr:PQQ-binding-like beta-propeller repeat protein [Pirellulales bacterium]
MTTEHPTADPAQPPAKQPRYWFPVLLLGSYWLYHLLCRPFDLDMFSLFVSRMAVLAVVLVTFPIWWLTSRQLRPFDRTFGVGVVIVAVLAASFIVVNGASVPGLIMVGLPLSYTAATIWLLVARQASKRVWRIGLAVAICLPLGWLTLFRWEGLTGDQQNELRWRWESTAEERFLAVHEPVEPATAPADVVPLSAEAGDWTGFRGPQRDGVVHGATIATDWRQHPPRLVWRQRVGPAWSSMTVVAGRLFTQEQRGEREAVVCYDAATGRELWSHEDTARFSEGVSGIGPRATPTFDHGRLYTSGGTGLVNCLDAATGRKTWSRDLVAESGAAAPKFGFWGFSCSPLVVDGVVIVYAGGEGHEKLWGLDAESGKTAWSLDAGRNNYSSPQVATWKDQQQVLFSGELGLMAVEPASGELLWKAPDTLKSSNAMVQPHVLGSNELVVAADGGLVRMAVDRDGGGFRLTPRWSAQAKGLRPTFNDFVVHNGAIYGFDEGIFGCLDLDSGKRTWKRGRYGHGQVLLLADQDVLLVTAESGELVLLAADSAKFRELAKFQALEGKTWNHPALAHGRLYLRNGEEMACYELSSMPSGEEQRRRHEQD